MSKKRKKKYTVFAVVEGEREKCFLNFLKEIYKPKENNINLTSDEPNGGTPDKLLGETIKNCDRSGVFVWCDEDLPLSEEVRKCLAIKWMVDEKEHEKFFSCQLRNLESKFNLRKRNPRLIVSQPVCVESFILSVLGRELPYAQYDPTKRDMQISNLKKNLQGLINKTDEIQFYRNKLTKEILEERRQKIMELDILISMITP